MDDSEREGTAWLLIKIGACCAWIFPPLCVLLGIGMAMGWVSVFKGRTDQGLKIVGTAILAIVASLAVFGVIAFSIVRAQVRLPRMQGVTAYPKTR